MYNFNMEIFFQGFGPHKIPVAEIGTSPGWEQIALISAYRRTSRRSEHLLYKFVSIDLSVQTAGLTLEQAEDLMRQNLLVYLEIGEPTSNSSFQPKHPEVGVELSQYFQLKNSGTETGVVAEHPLLPSSLLRKIRQRIRI